MPNRVIRIIWLALLMSIVIYGVLAFITVPAEQPQPFEAAFSNPVIVAVYIAGAAVFLMSFVVPPILMRSPAAPSAGQLTAMAARVRTSLIIRWAMTEGAAVCGLLAALLAKDFRLFLPLGGLALAGLLMGYPSDDRLLAAP